MADSAEQRNWFEQPCGRVLWQFPASPGKQCEQGVTLFTHAHLRHLAVLLHLQHRRRRNGARDEGEDKGEDKDEGKTRSAGMMDHGLMQLHDMHMVIARSTSL